MRQRAAGAIAEFVLGEVARDRVDPRGELLRRIEAVEVPRDPNEGFLDQVLSPVRVARLAGDEVDQAIPIAIVEALEGAGATVEMGSDELFIRQVVESTIYEELAHVLWIGIDHGSIPRVRSQALERSNT